MTAGGASRRLGHDEAIGGVANLAPRQRRKLTPGEERRLHRREGDSHLDGVAPAREVPADEEFVVAETSIRRLGDMLSRAEFVFWIGIDARVGAGGVPN